MIKGIIFDMDGVMIDTELQSNLGWHRASALKGVEMPMWLMDSFKGTSPQISAEIFNDYYHKQLNKSDMDYWEMREMRSNHVYKIRETEDIPVKKGLMELLDFISENDLKCAVATSTQKTSAEKTLHKIGAWDYLDAVVYGDEVENSKPEPDIFLKAASAIGLEPSECIVIEDSINGIKAGRAAGMKVVHIPDTIDIDDETRALTDVVCQDLTCVPEIVKNNVGSRDTKTVMNYVFVDRMKVKNTFAEYTDRYDSKDPKIKLKIDHTYRVAALCERIAAAAGMCAYDVELAWLSGMLHDVGRFEQVKRYNTFLDSESVDHARFGADLLFKEGLYEEFLGDCVKCTDYKAGENEPRYKDGEFIYNKLNKSDMEVLELAIRCHNMYRVPEGLNEREMMFCNILRDADKVDIIKVNVDTPLEDIYNVTTEELKNGVITDAVMDAFYEEHCILKSLRKVAVDNVIGHVSLAFELVYDESVRIMKQQGYLDKLMSFESNSPKTMEQFAKVREVMNSYINRRIG